MTSGTLYHYRVKSKDASNNLTTSNDFTFTTTTIEQEECSFFSGLRDCFRSSIYILPPTGLTATVVSSSQVNLTWTAPAPGPTPVSGYRIFKNSIQIDTSIFNRYSVGNLDPSTAYTFTVEAYDPVGNTSPLSLAVTVTTQSPPTPPSTLAPAISPSPIISPSPAVPTPLPQSSSIKQVKKIPNNITAEAKKITEQIIQIQKQLVELMRPTKEIHLSLKNKLIFDQWSRFIYSFYLFYQQSLQ